MNTKTIENAYAPSKFDLLPALISTVATDNYIECLEHEMEVAEIGDICRQVSEIDAGLEHDMLVATALRHAVGDYRPGDLLTERQTDAVCRVVAVCGDELRCRVVAVGRAQLICVGYEVYLSKSDLQ